jgi:hypothetical protein
MSADNKVPDSWLERINAVLDFFFDPCDAPLTLYVKTFFAGALDAFIILWTFDPQQFFISWGAPKKMMARARSQKKGRFGSKSKGKFGKYGGRVLQYLDPSDLMGKAMPGAEHLQGRYVHVGVAHLWNFFGRWERLAWWLFVVELVTLALYRWISFLMGSRFCAMQGATMLTCTNPPQTISYLGGWNDIVFNDIEKIRGNVIWNFAAGIFSGDQCHLVVGGTVVNATEVDDVLHVRLMAPSGSVVAQVDVPVASGSSAEWGVKTSFPGTLTFRAEAISEAAFLELTNQSLTLWGDIPNVVD